MKRNQFHRDYGWVKGLVWFLVGAVGVSLWWSIGISRVEHPMHEILPRSQLELPRSMTPIEIESTTRNTDQATDPQAKVIHQRAESYWIETTGDGLVLVPKPIEAAGDLSQETALKLAFEELLKGRADIGFSAIPEGTQLLVLELQPNGIYVNLSHEFGEGGGSASMIERVGQVIFTASSVDPNESIMLAVEGKLISPDNPLGGEGLILDQPVTRGQYIAQYSLY